MAVSSLAAFLKSCLLRGQSIESLLQHISCDKSFLFLFAVAGVTLRALQWHLFEWVCSGVNVIMRDACSRCTTPLQFDQSVHSLQHTG